MQDRTPPDAKYPPPKPGEPPLHRAARVGDVAAIRRLVHEGHDINVVFDIEPDPEAPECPATPLMVAAGSGDGATAETVQCLLDLGADPKVTTAAGSAATFACLGLGWKYRPGGDAARLRLLLKAGSPLPTINEALNSMLCDVAGCGDAERLGVLLDLGLNPNGYWSKEQAHAQQRQLAERLAGYHRSLPDPIAALPPDVRAQLVEAGERVAKEMFEQQSRAPSGFEIPLFRAAQAPDGACLRALLAAGANPLVRDNAMRTAMYYAGSTEAVRLLMDAGVPLEDTDELGWSPLVDAISDGVEALPRVRALIEAGADVNATHDRGYTVFMSAVSSSSRHFDVLKLLIAAGANPHAVSELGYNAFHAAVDVIGEANAEQSVRETLGYLRELGVDIEQRNNDGHTPLARALAFGYGLEAEVLCELGANPNAVCPMHKCGEGGCTRAELPLLFHAVIGIGLDNGVKTAALLRAGADPLATDADGCTPLQRVVAVLCSNASDYEAAYRSFFEGLSRIRLQGQEAPATRDAFLAAVTPVLAEYVTKFASGIPVAQTSEYEAKGRQERLACIVSLCAYEGWVRHERTKRSAARPGA